MPHPGDRAAPPRLVVTVTAPEEMAAAAEAALEARLAGAGLLADRSVRGAPEPGAVEVRFEVVPYREAAGALEEILGDLGKGWRVERNGPSARARCDPRSGGTPDLPGALRAEVDLLPWRDASFTRALAEQSLEELLAEFALAAGEHGADNGPGSDPWHARAVAVSREIRSRGPGARARLLSLVGHPDPWVRLWSASYGLEIDAGRAAAALEELRRHPRPAVSAAAAAALERWRRGELDLL